MFVILSTKYRENAFSPCRINEETMLNWCSNIKYNILELVCAKLMKTEQWESTRSRFQKCEGHGRDRNLREIVLTPQLVRG